MTNETRESHMYGFTHNGRESVVTYWTTKTHADQFAAGLARSDRADSYRYIGVDPR